MCKRKIGERPHSYVSSVSDSFSIADNAFQAYQILFFSKISINIFYRERKQFPNEYKLFLKITVIQLWGKRQNRWGSDHPWRYPPGYRIQMKVYFKAFGISSWNNTFYVLFCRLLGEHSENDNGKIQKPQTNTLQRSVSDSVYQISNVLHSFGTAPS